MTKQNFPKLITAALVLAGTFWVSGCSPFAPQADKSRYFVLSSSAVGSANATTTRKPPFTVGLQPVTVPHYLDRPEILTRVNQSELSASDTDRWGEPLKAGASRVLAEDLTARLSNAEVVPFPWSKKTQIDYLVSVEFLNLEKTADGRATTKATWIIRRGADGNLVERGTTVAESSAGADQTAASAALSQGIGQVASAIAQSVEKHQTAN